MGINGSTGILPVFVVQEKVIRGMSGHRAFLKQAKPVRLRSQAECLCYFSMHLHRTAAEATAVIVELNVGVVGEKGHRDGGIGDALGNHEGGEALAERVVMRAGLPD